MSAPLSIIIPTLNSAADLGPTLACAFAGVEAGLVKELVLTDGGSQDAVEALADEIGAVFVSGPRGRGRQLAAGADAARGDWLLFLHADTVLSPGWVIVVRAHMADPDQAGHFRLAFDARGFAPRLVARWANLRSRVFGLPYGDQGLLISRKLYSDVGGFKDIPLMEDVAMARTLKGKLRVLPVTATTSAQRYLRDGWLRRGGRNLGTLALYFLGRSPEELSRRYHSE